MQELDLRSLEIFRAVAVEGSVTKAAEKLHRVQSNISTRIKQLEERLQKPLFLRQNRRLILTADGELLLSYADRLLQLSMAASEALNEDTPRGVFRIGTMESTAISRLPEILSEYHQLYPDVRIELETDVAGGLLDRLRNHDIEIAFAAEPVSFSDLVTMPVFAETLVLVAPESLPAIDDPATLSGKTVVAFEPGCAYRRYLEEWLLEAGIVPGGIISVSSYPAILACVSAGAGFAVVPQSVLDRVSTGAGLRFHALPEKVSGIRTLLASRADYRSVKLDALRKLLPAFEG